MKFITTILATASLLASPLFAADPEADAIKFAQQWAFALAGSAKTQIEAGATDPKAIRKKATEDAEPLDKKLRAAMKAAGMTPKEIEQGIKNDRKLYLGDIEAKIEAFQKKKAKK